MALMKSYDLTVGGQGDGFHVYVSGRIESGQFCDVESLTTMYDFTHGPDWTLEQGSESGETQRSRNVRGQMDDASCSWNFPVDLVYHSTNVHGWPRLVLTCRDDRRVLVGYGNPRLPASNFGREVTRTTSHGIVKVQLTVSTSGMSKFGYSETKGHQNNRSHDNVGKC